MLLVLGPLWSAVLIEERPDSSIDSSMEWHIFVVPCQFGAAARSCRACVEASFKSRDGVIARASVISPSRRCPRDMVDLRCCPMELTFTLLYLSVFKTAPHVEPGALILRLTLETQLKFGGRLEHSKGDGLRMRRGLRN